MTGIRPPPSPSRRGFRCSPGSLAILLLAALLSRGLLAGTYHCTAMDPSDPEHASAYQAFEDAMQMPPDAFLYCQGKYPRWVARWGIYESRDGWEKFATSVYFAGDPHRIVTRRHVAVPGSHEVVDLPYDVPLERVAQLHQAAKMDRPSAEVARIEYVEVTDGGAWSAETHGYAVYLLEPPGFTGGDFLHYVRSCDGPCRWACRGVAGAWRPSSSDKRLRDEQRRIGSPIIDVLHYVGRG